MMTASKKISAPSSPSKPNGKGKSKSNGTTNGKDNGNDKKTSSVVVPVPPANNHAALITMPAATIPEQSAPEPYAYPMVATVKVAPFKTKSLNSVHVTKCTVPRRTADTNQPLTVGEWTRSVVESNPDWLIKLLRRCIGDKNVAILTYGAGYETLVLMDEAVGTIPVKFADITRVPVGLSTSSCTSGDDEVKLAARGVLTPTDLIWDHLRFQSQDTSNTKPDSCLCLHNKLTLFGPTEATHKRVLQINTNAPSDPNAFKEAISNAQFEAEVHATWSGARFGTTDVVVTEEEGVSDIVFNSLELILLEKALLDQLQEEDMVIDVNAEYGESEIEAGLAVIHRANDQFREFTKRTRKKTTKSEDDATAPPKSPTRKPASPKTAAPKGPAKKAPTKAAAAKAAKLMKEEEDATEQIQSPQDESPEAPPTIRSSKSRSRRSSSKSKKGKRDRSVEGTSSSRSKRSRKSTREKK